MITHLRASATYFSVLFECYTIQPYWCMMHSLSHGCTASSFIDTWCTGLSCIVMPDAQHQHINWFLHSIEPYCAIMMPDEQHWAILTPDTQHYKPYWCLMHIIELWMHSINPYWCMIYSYIDAWCTALSFNWCMMHSIDTSCIALSRIDAWCISHQYCLIWLNAGIRQHMAIYCCIMHQ